MCRSFCVNPSELGRGLRRHSRGSEGGGHVSGHGVAWRERGVVRGRVCLHMRMPPERPDCSRTGIHHRGGGSGSDGEVALGGHGGDTGVTNNVGRSVTHGSKWSNCLRDATRADTKRRETRKIPGLRAPLGSRDASHAAGGAHGHAGREGRNGEHSDGSHLVWDSLTNARRAASDGIRGGAVLENGKAASSKMAASIARAERGAHHHADLEIARSSSAWPRVSCWTVPAGENEETSAALSSFWGVSA